MNSDSTTPSLPPKGDSPQPVRKKRSWLLMGCGGLLALLLIIVATVAITIWWIQRPIKPVILSAAEKQVVETKLQQVRSAPAATRDERLSPAPRPNSTPSSTSNRYIAGGKELRLTERELNGLLNENTDLGKTVRLELDTDAINAYVA